MTHHTDADLMPCPFCGGKAYFEIDDGQWEWVECGSCGMQGNRSASLMEDCKPKLAEAWNRRAPVVKPPTVAQVEEAVGMGADAWDCIPPQAIIDAILQLAGHAAPAAPVPQSEPVGSVYTMEALVPGGREVQHVSLYMPLPAGTKLYAAPQPPEAAPVELPEPVAYRLRNTAFRSEVYEYFRTKYLAECRQKQFNASVDDGGLHELTPIYTEQQVRELLANHGIQEQST